MLRRMCISLAAIAVAAAPALTVLASATSTADASVASTVASTATTLTYHSSHALAVKHGFIRNGGTAVHLVEPGTEGVHSDTLRLNATATSTNWSGYAATGGTYTSVSASWVQPTGS